MFRVSFFRVMTPLWIVIRSFVKLYINPRYLKYGTMITIIKNTAGMLKARALTSVRYMPYNRLFEILIVTSSKESNKINASIHLRYQHLRAFLVSLFSVITPILLLRAVCL